MFNKLKFVDIDGYFLNVNLIESIERYNGSGFSYCTTIVMQSNNKLHTSLSRIEVIEKIQSCE